jgi:hypothetical protein
MVGMGRTISDKSLLTMKMWKVYTALDRAAWLWEDSMNISKSPNGKISIHEPLEIDMEHPEEIFDRDILKRSDLAERILTRLREGDCPRALGIYGGWGTGKTSLLNLLEQLNKHAPGGIPSSIHLVSIDAWEHESSEGLLIPVVVELDKIKGTDIEASHMAVVVKRALFASGMLVADALLKKYVNLGVGDFQLGIKQVQEVVTDTTSHDTSINAEILLGRWRRDAEEISQTKKAFATLVKSACSKEGWKKIVICIDNLDRCSPENVVRLLESVKVFFSVPDCTWVFAMDSEVVASYINHKYEGTRVDGNSYLDKIVPEQYHLSFFPEENDRRVFDLIRVATGSDLTLNEWKRLPLLPHVMVPRRLKKSAAKFAEYFDGDRSDAERDTVFLLSLLYHAWPDFYQRLSSASVDHVGGILANFFKSPNVEMHWGEYTPLPLDKKFTEDQDLIYFLKTAFPGNTVDTNVVHEIRRAMDGLRQVGLP